MSRLFARHRGRHRRHGSLTGWSALSHIPIAGLDDVSRPRVERVDLIPFAGYRRPYDSQRGTAA